MVYVINVKNVLDEDTLETGVVHIECATEAEALDLVAEIVREEESDPADFSIVAAPDDWACVGHGDGVLCTAPLLN